MEKTFESRLIIDLVIGFERSQGPRLFQFYFGPILNHQNANVLSDDGKRYLFSIYTYMVDQLAVSVVVAYYYDQDIEEKCFYTVSLHKDLKIRDLKSIANNIGIFPAVEISTKDTITHKLLGNKLMQAIQNTRALLEYVKE